VRAPLLSGFCNAGNPEDSHGRCAGCGCTCHGRATAGDPVEGVTEAVHQLEGALPALLEACTDPQATDMAELLLTIREARTALLRVEQDTEAACAKAMLSDQVDDPSGLFVERYRSADRKAWDHEQWQHDVRTKALQAAGLKGAQGVLTANGEVLPAEVLHELLATVQSVHSAGAPKTSKTAGLRAFGLDPADYCETTPGARHVKVQRRVATDTEGTETDAA
jgi:hypothetical protein